MSRINTSDVVEIKPSNNIYTVLTGIAILVQLLGFLVLFIKAGEIFMDGKGLFS